MEITARFLTSYREVPWCRMLNQGDNSRMLPPEKQASERLRRRCRDSWVKLRCGGPRSPHPADRLTLDYLEKSSGDRQRGVSAPGTLEPTRYPWFGQRARSRWAYDNEAWEGRFLYLRIRKRQWDIGQGVVFARIWYLYVARNICIACKDATRAIFSFYPALLGWEGSRCGEAGSASVPGERSHVVKAV